MRETGIVSNNRVPGSMTQVGITMKYTFLDFFCSRRFFILLIITLLITALLTILVGYYRPQSFLASDLSFYGSWWGNSVTFVIILSGIFFGGDAISGEFQNKTGYFGLPNPIRRSSVYIGKWLAAFFASTVILGVFTAITVSNGMYYFGLNVPYPFGESVPYPPHSVVNSFGPRGGISITTFNVQVPEGLAIIGLYFIITAILGLVLFERK